jgi:aspartyl protease/PDZ domain-containing protein
MTSDRGESGARVMRFFAAALAGFVLGAGCGVPSEHVPPLWLGRSGERLPAATGANVFWIEADVDGERGPQVIVDTGAPITLLHVESFNGAVSLGSGRVVTLTLGPITLWKVPVFGDHGDPTSLTPSGQLDGGIVGYTAFGQFPMSFNYRDNQLVIGQAPPADGVLAPLTLPFSLEGGGAGPLVEGGEIIEFPASRVIVPGTVEGTPLTFLLDTGASWVALRSSTYRALVSDGRRQLTVEASLAQGSATTDVARLRSVEVGGGEVTAAVAASGPKVDELLFDLSSEVGHPIDGLLGAPFLREFYLTVDYPMRALDLYRFASEAHVLDDYRRVGIEVKGLVSEVSNTYLVARVYAGTDAARQGIRVGETLLVIDGMPLFTLDIATVDRKLRGAVGSSRHLEFADRALDVLVDELLPLSP